MPLEFTIVRQIHDIRPTLTNGRCNYKDCDIITEYVLKAHNVLNYKDVARLVDEYCNKYYTVGDGDEFDFHCECERYGYVLSNIGFNPYLSSENTHRYKSNQDFVLDDVRRMLKDLIKRDNKNEIQDTTK